MKILTIQNRMGIGDMVIFLPFIESIAKNFNSPIALLVKESSKANEYLNNNSKIKKIIDLKRSNKITDIMMEFWDFLDWQKS